MAEKFKPGGLQTWIGSLPIDSHIDAVRLMAQHTPEIPVWIQLPIFKAEGMIAQALAGMPGLVRDGEREFICADNSAFDTEIISFFEEYLEVAEGKRAISDSRFAMTKQAAPGFFEFIKYLESLENLPAAIKGQVVGPFTFSTSVKDQDGRAVFYHPELKEASTKCIATKARWQVSQLKKYKIPVIIFLDEPGLAAFGSSAFISITKEDIHTCLSEVIAAVHEEGAIAGVHVCANTDWSLVLDSSADIASFDAYSFFDRFILYEKQIKHFLQRGGILAWGIVPTGNISQVDQENVDSLFNRWKDQVHQIAALGFDEKQIVAQSLITPSCGTGSLPLDRALKVIQMTREISLKIRRNF